MRKILMRSSMNPLKAVSTAEAVTRDVMNGNTGNMLFAHAITRTLLCEDTQIDVTSTGRNFSRSEVDRINEEYSCFVIPLANAFRPKFEDELDAISRLVRQLHIPCVVIGVGVQAKVGETVDKEFEFDRSAVKFIKAVLEKSSCIGVRGEVTAEYMKKLGFQEERDFTVIGCPSMYLYGEELPLKPVRELTPDSPVSVNRKINIPAKLHQFLYDSSMQFHDAMFVPQGIDDLLLLYAGKFIDRTKYPKIHKTYPWRMNHPICAQGKEIGFTNVPSWLEFLRGRNFSFGSRIHGNIAAVLAGTPAYILAPDARILELARYHHIAHMPAGDLNEKTNIFDLYEKADFTGILEGHRERFDHYLDFLEANGLKHVFGSERKNCRTPFDKILEEQDFSKGGITSLNLQNLEEQTARLDAYYGHLAEHYGTLHNIERYAKFEKAMMAFLDKTPGGWKRKIKKCIKRAVD